MPATWKSTIPQAQKRTRKELAALVARTAFKIEQRAKILAPVDTGNLRRSIQTAFEGDLTAVVFVAAEYGIYVEFGTRRMRAQPFLLPAAEEAIAAIGGELKQVVG